MKYIKLFWYNPLSWNNVLSIWYSHIQNLVAKFEWFNKSIAKIIITSSKISTAKKYDYWNKFNRDSMNKTLIQLPTKNNQPDYKIMEILISAVEKILVRDVVWYCENKI